jgi:hypothetical protein
MLSKTNFNPPARISHKATVKSRFGQNLPSVKIVRGKVFNTQSKDRQSESKPRLAGMPLKNLQK